MIEARQLAQQWKVKECPERPARALFDGTSSNTTLLLAALVVAFRRDHQLLERIRRHFRKELKKLSGDHPLADALAACLMRMQPELTPKQLYDTKRRKEHSLGIEGEYGGRLEALVAELRKLNRAPDNPYVDDFYKDFAPKCLDEIFKGGRVKMQKLQELFEMERHQFPKSLPNISKGRETFYDYRAVATIMDALLTEKPKEKRRKLGRSPRIPWLNDPRLRMRVLRGIETRINSLSVQEHIKATFLSIVRRHLPDSGKK